eukprot:Nitzschia sp. Nitz4//scaffold453_size6330//1117//1662//NITZ4_009178-RA/size6330-processed-gene-0.13-mRNA-1//-1//CDS//3329552269//532//frame0
MQESNTEYKGESTAIPVATPATVVATKKGPQAHRFLFCLCDTRRAIIIVDTISIIFAVLLIAGWGAFTSPAFEEKFDDDVVLKDLNKLQNISWVAYVYCSLSALFCAIGIFGAVKFNPWLVLGTSIWYGLSVVCNIVAFDIGSTIFSILFAYPHVVFYTELKSGVMSEETYPEEKYSCCCV